MLPEEQELSRLEGEQAALEEQVTTAELAEKSGVKMIGRSDIGNLMAQHKAKTNNG